MARTPLKPDAQQLLFDESLKPDGGTRVFHSPQDFAAAAPAKKKPYKRRDFSSLATSYLNEAERLVVEAKQSEDPAATWRSITAAGSMVHAVDYVQWVFQQQKKRLRRSGGDSTWRVGWRWLFMKRELMTDYRRSLVQGERKRRA